MDYEKIIRRGLRRVRKLVSSPSYAQDLMKGNFDTDEILNAIKHRIKKCLFATSLEILKDTAHVCSFVGTPRYLHALIASLKDIGAEERIDIIPYTYLAKSTLILDGYWLHIYDLSEKAITIGLEDQMINVACDPKIVAKMVSTWRDADIPSSMLTDILSESFALNKIEEILLPTARLIIEDIIKDSRIKTEVFLVGSKILKVRLSVENEIHIISTFYTSLDNLRKEVQKKIKRYNKQQLYRGNSLDESKDK